NRLPDRSGFPSGRPASPHPRARGRLDGRTPPLSGVPLRSPPLADDWYRRRRPVGHPAARTKCARDAFRDGRRRSRLCAATWTPPPTAFHEDVKRQEEHEPSDHRGGRPTIQIAASSAASTTASPSIINVFPASTESAVAPTAFIASIVETPATGTSKRM